MTTVHVELPTEKLVEALEQLPPREAHRRALHRRFPPLRSRRQQGREPDHTIQVAENIPVGDANRAPYLPHKNIQFLCFSGIP